MFHAWRNHPGEVVVVAGVCLLLYLSLVRFYIIRIYSEEGGRGDYRSNLAVMPGDLWLTGQRQLAVEECSRKF